MRTTSPLHSTRLRAELMEERILHSADVTPLAWAGTSAWHASVPDEAAMQTADSAVPRHEIVFVDAAVPDADSLLADLHAQRNAGRPIEIVAIGSGQDGLALIGATLAGRHDIGAVHVLAHGDDGMLQLGTARLDAQTLLQRAGEVAAWGSALADDADLLLYGCDLAQTAAGQQFAADLAALTGADVAASTDLTGAVARGGDWALEFSSGTIQTAAVLTCAAQQAWSGVLLVPTNETLVNQSTSGTQATTAEDRGSQQSVALDAAGNYVVVWTSENGQDGSGQGVYARRFNPSGAAISAEIRVNTWTTDDQRSARVVSDAAGNFVVTWTSENQDGSSDGVYMRRFDANAVALTAETRVNTTTGGAQADSVIAISATTGDFVVAWQGPGPGDGAGIFYRRFNANGSAKDAGDRLANATTAGTQADPAVTMAADGKFQIVWEVTGELFFQRFDAAGNALGSAAQVDSGLNDASGAAVASDAAGNFTVVYRVQSAVPGVTGIWGVGFKADGSEAYPWFQIDTGDATSPSIDMAGDGSFVVVYQKTGDALDVFARQYNADASAAGAAFLVNQGIVQDQSNASVSALDTNNFVVAWNGSGPGDSKGVFARQFGSSVQFTATQDTTINSGSATNYGNSASLVVNRSGGNLGSGRALLQFDLSTIPVGATVTGATLQLQATANASPFKIDVYRLTEAWVEGNGGTSAANWNDRLPGTAWTNIDGASVDPTPAATWGTLPPPGAGLHSWDLTTLVQAWQTGSSANHGILLGSTSGGGTTVTYDSSEGATPPRLLVTYTLPTAPVNTVPGAQSTNEDTAKVFSAANGNPISIADADAGGTNNQVTLSVSNGSLTLAGMAGLSFTSGDGTADASMTFRGTVSAINTALNGLSYVPASNYNGGATLTLTTKDSGLLSLDVDTGLRGRYAFENTGALGTDTSPAAAYPGTVSGATAVSDPTRGNVLSLDGNDYIQTAGHYGNPANVTLAAWVNLASADSTGADVLSLGDSVVLRLDQANGWLIGSFYDDGIGWTVTDYATTLAGAGWHHVAYSVNDAGNAATLYLDGVAVSSTGTSNSISYTLGANSFIGTHGNANPNFDFDGKIDDARIYSRALTASEIATLAADLSRTATDTVAITVSPVNDAPTATNLSAAETYTEDTLRNLSNIVVSDADSADVTATLSLSNVAAGSLNTGTSGAVTSTFVAGVWTASGAIADVNTLLAGLSFTPSANFNGNFAIATSVSDDAGAAVSGSKAMTGTAVNDAPAITSNGGGAGAAVNVAENATAVTAVTATDADLPAQTLTYSISGGADAARFSINASTGVLSFSTAPNYEAPTDAGANNVYDVTVRVSDGTLSDTQAIAVTVMPVNDANPVITSNGGGISAAVSVAENATAVTTVTATDADLPAQTLTYSISGGADAARFSIDTSTGVLSFVAAPNFEAPSDASANNVYDVTVRVSDGTLSDTQSIAVTVTPVNDNTPVITSDGGSAGAAVSVAENATAVTTITATDADLPAQTLTYSISGGADAARFSINASTGVLSFNAAPNHEAPSDAGADNVYDVTVRVSDGTLSDNQAIAVTVTPVNDINPVITSNGGGASAALSVAENATAVTTVTATDADLPGQTLTYSISGGADAARFSIDTSTGVLSFNAAPNHEAPGDDGANNVYDVTVRVSDGTLSDNQVIAVTVSDANEFPVGAVSDVDAGANGVAENAGVGTVVGLTAHAIDPDATTNAISYALDDSAAGRFAIDAATGVLRVAGALDYETSTSHDVTVRATSADGSFATALFTIAVTNVNDAGVGAINDSNGATNRVAENAAAGTSVGLTASAVDPDVPDVVTYSLTDDAGGRFAINTATGVVVVAAALDAETATSHNIVVRADSTDGSFNTQSFTIAVADFDEFDIGTVSDIDAAVGAVDENAAIGSRVGITASAVDADATNSAVIYSLDDSAGNRFAIDGSTGVVTVAGTVDREAAPSHTIVVRAASADGSFSTQSFSIAVAPLNDNSPAITSDGGGASASINVAENVTAVTTVTATDADLPAQTLTYSIVGGADQARFNINGSTGALSFTAAPDYESPSDIGADNVYDVTVQVSDGSLGSTQAISVTVNPANDSTPAITSDGGGASASISVTENTSVVTTVTAGDADLPAQTLTYSIVGGADQARFNIDAATGVLRFASAPDYESPSDAGADNVYDVTVQVSDGSLGSTQAISVTVSPDNDNSPVITSDGGGPGAAINVAENDTAVTTVIAGDADLPAQTLTYSIVGGADQARFNINSATGVLSFAAAPDYEAPSDAGADNVYDLTVQVSDGSLGSTQAISVTVNPANDSTPAITSDGGGASASISVTENTSVVTTVTAGDADLPAQTLTYSIVGGADQARFNIDAATGVLSFAAAPDYEAPSDAGADNVYDVTVQVSDGSLGSTQAISVTVNPANDSTPAITSDGGGASASISVTENTSVVTTVTAGDADLPAQTLTYSIVGGADQARFNIDAATGVLRFASAPDYESPSDAGADNVYDVTVQVSDGSLGSTQAISVTVSPDNDNSPVITSDGGGPGAAINVAENDTAVTTVIAGDADLPAQTLTYSIVGGADQARFNINSATGVLSFAAAPDYEAPSDAGADNVYDLTVQVSDGSLGTTQAISVSVDNLNEAPVGRDNSVGTPEDRAYTFGTADFGFGDPIDRPANGLSAVFVTTLPGAGTLTSNGVAVTAGQAIDATDIAAGGLVFTPAADASGAGYASFTFQVQDDGGTANGGVDRDQTLRTMTIDAIAQNDAPVLTGANNLSAMNEDPVGNRGTLVSALIAGQVSDVDGAALSGIAVSAVNNANGAWQYSTDGGANWLPFGAATEGSAVLLAADAATSVRFVPNPDWNGGVSGGIGFRAWDRSSGSAGSTADTRTHGGSSAFSATTASAGITVHPVNDVPIAANAIPNQAALEDTGFALTLAPGTFADIDAGDTLGLSTRLASGAALPAWLAFDAATGRFSGTPTNADVGALTIRVSATDAGGARVFSDFDLAVSNVNDAPTLGAPIVDQRVGAGSSLRFRLPDATFVDADAGDTLRFTASLDDGSPLPDWLVFDEQTLTFSGTPRVEQVAAFMVRVTATDDAGAAAQARFAMVVAAPVAETLPVAGPAVTPAPAPALAADLRAEATPAAAAAVDPAPAPRSTRADRPSSTPLVPDAASAVASLESAQDAPQRGAATVSAADTTRPASRSDTVLASALVTDFKALSLASITKLLRGDDLARALEEIQRQMLEPGDGRRTAVASAMVATGGLSVGYVVWLVRGGVLVSSMLSALPAWQMIDPLPVLAASGDKRDKRDKRRQPGGPGGRAAAAADDGDVERLFDDREARPTPPTPPAPPAPPTPAPARAAAAAPASTEVPR